MLRSTRALGLALLLLCAVGAACAQTPRVFVGGELYIGLDGTVQRVVVDEDTNAEVKALVEKTVSRWRFEPPMVEGAPSQVRVGMRLDLEGMQAEAGRFRLRVTKVAFDSARIREARLVLPQLNTTMDVLTALRVDAAGNVTDVAVVYMEGSGARGAGGAKRMAMAREIERALKKSKFRTADLAYGGLADETMFLPINYRLDRGPDPPPVDPEQRAKDAARIPWLADEDQAELPEAQTPGTPMAMHQPDVRLSTQVVGTLL
jgi:hypothetical protein